MEHYSGRLRRAVEDSRACSYYMEQHIRRLSFTIEGIVFLRGVGGIPYNRISGSDGAQSVWQYRVGGNMKRHWILRVSTVGLVSGLLFGTVARGKTLFVRHCTGCHGPEGGVDGYQFLSGPDPAKLTSPSIRKKSDADLFQTIHEGKPNMPPWKTRLSQEESRDILAYVRTLAK